MPAVCCDRIFFRCHLQYIIRRAWLDRTLIASRKRKHERGNGHIWHFVNTNLVRRRPLARAGARAKVQRSAVAVSVRAGAADRALVSGDGVQ